MTQDFSEFGLGRNISLPDENNKRFLAVPAEDAENIEHKIHFMDQVFNQGKTSECVPHAGIAAMVAAPIRNWPNLSFNDLYKLCQKFDRWPGEDYSGTSVHGLCIALKGLGLIKEYRWATELNQVVDYVLTRGPMVIGVDWYEKMFQPDKQGFIHPEGGISGGHSVLLIGANRNTKCSDGTLGGFSILNSWGRSWGREDRAGNKNGRALISFKAFEQLLKDQGEAAVIIENKLN